MSKSNDFENDLLRLIFNGTAIANLADNAVTGPLTSLFLALHTSDPGEAGTQSTGEIAYTGYARIPVLRTSGGWAITANSVSPVANIEFAEMTRGVGGTATFVTIGVAITGATKVLYRGALNPTIAVTTGVIPRIKPTSTITED